MEHCQPIQFNKMNNETVLNILLAIVGGALTFGVRILINISKKVNQIAENTAVHNVEIQNIKEKTNNQQTEINIIKSKIYA